MSDQPSVPATTPKQKIGNLLFWLNHQANIYQSRSKKRRTQFAPCPRAIAIIDVLRGREKNVAALLEAESAALMTPCTCHAALTDETMLGMELLPAPKAGESAGVTWWGKYGGTP